MKRVAIIYGGVGEEHEVSLLSALRVYSALETTYILIPIYLSRGGHFYEQSAPTEHMMRKEDPGSSLLVKAPFGFFHSDGSPLSIDVVVPVVHGTGGEDGLLQGFLRTTGIPCIASGVLASAIGMHKSIAKTLAASHQVPVLPFTLLTGKDIRHYLDGSGVSLRIRDLLGYTGLAEPSYAKLSSALKERFGDHLIIKPDNEGSSIGVNELKAFDTEQLASVLRDVLSVSDRVLIEPFMPDRLEVECSVVEDSGWIVSTPVIIDKGGEPLTYHTKYEVKESLDNPEAFIPENICSQVQHYCLTLAEILEVEGFARIDFFVGKHSGEIYFNEINTLPGMTGRSVFPAMVESSGYPLRELLGMLIERTLWNG